MMAGFCDYGCTGRLRVGASFWLASPAWDIPNLTKLWFEHQIRGENLLVPSAAGRRGYPRRVDEATHNLVLYVTGEVDQFGTKFPDPWHGLRHNLDTLWTNVFQPVQTGNGTRACLLELPNGASVQTRSANVQFEPLRAQNDIDDPRLVAFTMTITIPAGRFT
jgi:hypothetical protein